MYVLRADNAVIRTKKPPLLFAEASAIRISIIISKCHVHPAVAFPCQAELEHIRVDLAGGDTSAHPTPVRSEVSKSRPIAAARPQTRHGGVWK